jgi:hypothetical protein
MAERKVRERSMAVLSQQTHSRYGVRTTQKLEDPGQCRVRRHRLPTNVRHEYRPRPQTDVQELWDRSGAQVVQAAQLPLEKILGVEGLQNNRMAFPERRGNGCLYAVGQPLDLFESALLAMELNGSSPRR